MFKKDRALISITMLALMVFTLACGIIPSAQKPVEDAPIQSQPNIEQPTDAPTENNASTGSDSVVSCAQLIPNDELKIFLRDDAPTLDENGYAGGTACTWQYTPVDAVQKELFYVQIDYSENAVQTWKSTREAELNNESSDTVVNSIDGLGDESYTWVSINGYRVVYVRQGARVLIFRFASGILALSTESNIIDFAERVFNRF